jgi:DNA (cytosine-5)-methyltransferase 1
MAAYHVGAPHQRERIWILANTSESGRRTGRNHIGAGRVLHYRNWYASENKRRRNGWVSWIVSSGGTAPNSELRGCEKPWWESESERPDETGKTPWEKIKPPVFRVDDGMADWVDRHHAIGNGQVPEVVELAWRTLNAQLMTTNSVITNTAATK